MGKDKNKKAKWIGHINFEGNISITQRIFTRDVVKFVKNQNKKFSTSVNVVHAYVFPYILNEAKKQSYTITSVSIREA